MEIGALTDTLILDEEGLYDPTNSNDRLLLRLNRPDTQSASEAFDVCNPASVAGRLWIIISTLESGRTHVGGAITT